MSLFVRDFRWWNNRHQGYVRLGLLGVAQVKEKNSEINKVRRSGHREPGVHDVTAVWMAGAAIPYVDLFSRLVFRRRSGHSDAEGQLRPGIAKGYNREEGQRIARKDHLGGEPASAPEKNGQTEKDQQCSGQPNLYGDGFEPSPLVIILPIRKPEENSRKGEKAIIIQ